MRDHRAQDRRFVAAYARCSPTSGIMDAHLDCGMLQLVTVPKLHARLGALLHDEHADSGCELHQPNGLEPIDGGTHWTE